MVPAESNFTPPKKLAPSKVFGDLQLGNKRSLWILDFLKVGDFFRIVPISSASKSHHLGEYVLGSLFPSIMAKQIQV